MRDMQTGGDDPLDLTLWYPAEGAADTVSFRYATKVSFPLGNVEVLATIDTETSGGGSLAGVVAPETVAVMGHSYGGYTTLAAGGAHADEAGPGP
jgi:predicted dienelactone hydrolase